MDEKPSEKTLKDVQAELAIACAQRDAARNLLSRTRTNSMILLRAIMTIYNILNEPSSDSLLDSVLKILLSVKIYCTESINEISTFLDMLD